MKLRETTILRTPVEIHVTQHGLFQVLPPQAGDEGVTALAQEFQLDAAIEKAKPEIRKRRKRVAVPFYETGDLTRRVAVGFHAGTGNVLLEDGRQVSGYRHSSGYHGDMPLEKRTELVRLREQRAELESQLAAIEDEYRLDLEEAVTEALGEATADVS